MNPRLSSRSIALALVLALACIPVAAAQALQAGEQGEAAVLASLEWPPYTGQALRGLGASSAVVREAFQHAGISLEIHFFPWARAVAMARTTGEYAGYFPEYRAARIEDSFLFSDSIGQSPLGFAETADAPVSWSTLHDLRGLIIGTVQGYVNTEEFDRMAEAGELRVEQATDDLTNLRKLLGGRIHLAVIDENVFLHLLATEPDLNTGRRKLRFNGKMLEMKELFVCFRRDADGERLAKLFNKGLAGIDARRVEAEALKAAMRPAP
ncbi:MAG: substrate-binding periplasmic protein [Thermodesulfobacteriota bacterium]